MRVLVLEEAFATPAERAYLPTPTPARLAMTADTQGRLLHNVAAELLDLGDSRIAAMDKAGIDMQVLSLTAPGPQGYPAEAAIAIARDTNDAAYEAVKRHPDRFAAFCAVPTSDVAAAVKELDRCVKLGFVGTLINGHTNGEFMDHRKYWPLFECAEALDVPIYIHPTMPPAAVMKSCFEGFEELARAPWGFSFETGLHFLRLVFAGVFDAFPRLKIILGHNGEGIPFVLDRIDLHCRVSVKRKGLKRSTSEYVREHMIVTTSGNFSVPAFKCTAEVMGLDNVLFSIDWPFESNEDGMDFLHKLPLNDTDMHKVAHGNAERVLKL